MEKEQKKFKLGDRVIWDERKGTIVAIEYAYSDKKSYGVKFDEKECIFHNLGGKCEDGYGYWCWAYELKLAPITLQDLQFADILILRNGQRYVVADEYMMGEDADYYCDGDVLNSCYTQDLKRDDSCVDKDLDIIKVERAGEVIYERLEKEPKEMTMEELNKILGYEVKIVEKKGSEE